jgi:hypothetical protein
MLYIWPVEDDGQRWVGVISGVSHNHQKPAAHVLSSSLKEKIHAAVKKDATLTTKEIQKGLGIGILPAEVSPAACNPERIRKERKIALIQSNAHASELKPLLQILEFKNIKKRVEGDQDELDGELTQDVNNLMGNYQMEGKEYIFTSNRKFAFFMAPYQAKLLGEAEYLFLDVTYTSNADFPYLLNLVTFNNATLVYNAVGRVLMDRVDGAAYATAIKEIFESVGILYPRFDNGKKLKQIMVDFDDAEYNGLKQVIGEKLAEKIIRGCSVHWLRSLNRVCSLVTTSTEEEIVFKAIGKKIEEVEGKEDVLQLFDVLCGNAPLKDALSFLSPTLRQSCKSISTVTWRKLTHWASWWTRERHLTMFTKAFMRRTSDDWDETPRTNNPVESINKQSIVEGSGKNLNVLLENIYLEDRLHAVKISGRSRNITTSYTAGGHSRKRKRSSFGKSYTDRDNGPPDKRRQICSEKRKSGKALINTCVEVEYQEEDSNGSMVYLGWLSGTIMAYNKSQGYLVRFDQLETQEEWDDWIPSVKSPDVRLL